MEEGRKLFIGETNPDVNCASCHGKDGKPVKAGARDFRVGERMKLYSDSVWIWRISEGVPNTKMKAWKSKLSEEDIWKLMLFERNFGLAGKDGTPTRNHGLMRRAPRLLLLQLRLLSGTGGQVRGLQSREPVRH